MGLLSVAIWLPIIAGVLLLALGRKEHVGLARWVALLAAVASLAVTIPLITGFDTGTAAIGISDARQLCRNSSTTSTTSTIASASVWITLAIEALTNSVGS